MSLEIRKVKNIRDLTVFTQLPGMISGYRVSGEIARPDQRANYDPAANPVHHHLKTGYFMAYRESKPVGRIAAIIDLLNPRKETGFFGCFECENDPEAASQLLNTACQWLWQNGATKMIGPATFNTNQQVGILIEGHELGPQPMLPHNPPYYRNLLEMSGLVKHTDLLTYSWLNEMGVPKRIARVADRVRKMQEVTIRRINASNIIREAPLVRDMFNGSMSANWGFIPLTTGESAAMLSYCSALADTDLMITVWYRGKPAGIALFLPCGHSGDDSPKSVRAAILGVLPQYRHKGLDSYMIEYMITTMLRKNYQWADISMIHEDNTAMLKIVTEVIGAPLTRRYRVYGTS